MKDKNIGVVSNGVYVTQNENLAKNIPAFVGGECEGVFAGGDNSFIVCINNASQNDITNYINTLEKQGYAKTLENKIGDNSFYSYANKDNLIFVYYIKALNSVKLIAEPFYAFSYNEPIENIVKPCVITSSACDRNYYIRLSNNKLVVIDGGWRIEDWSRFEPEELLKQMYDEMAEICNSEQINVSLWIITHAHTDHGRVLEFLYQMPFADKFNIDRILFNFPDDSHLDKQTHVAQEVIDASTKQLTDWHKFAGIDFPYEEIFYNCPFPVYDTIEYATVCRNAFKQYNAIKIKAHDGMKFDLSGVVFEVLHTPDDDMPTIYKNMNDTSLVIKMTCEDTATLWLGDMGVIPGNSCIEMYGDYLKCDAVQVSHHGWGSASWEFFKLLNPAILLWNNSEFGFQYADKYQGYGKTESSTRLFNMPCVKQNYFCNTIKMQYIDLPIKFEEEKETIGAKLLVSAASDQTFMVKLNNGKLVMINGSWRKEMWDKYDHAKLLNNLFLEMQEFAGTDEVTVEAWVVTDADPLGNQFLQNLKTTDFAEKIKVENIVYNFSKNFTNKEFEETVMSVADNCIIAEKGKKLNVNDTKMEILYAPECENFVSERDASVVLKLIVDGKKIIFTGNMTDRISQEILNGRGELNCDIVQVANHGLNDGGVLDFYEKCKAKIQVWNTSEYAYRFFSPDEGYEKSQVSTKVYNLIDAKNNYFCDRILPQIISL